jgi:N4-acetylcytidine amidohydrolase
MMTEPLPPKTCTIDRLVTLADEVEKVLAGTKTAVRRNGRYADLDEMTELRGKTLQVTKVYRQALGELTDTDAAAEGYPNVDAYKDSILAIHPGMPWLPHMKVWVHEFQIVE